MAVRGFASALVFLSSLAFSDAQTLTISSTLPGSWNSQGCYTEVVGRTLAADAYTDPANMTIESCIRFCAKGGFNYAGMEYSSQCYCDYTIAAGATTAPSTDCNMECDGDATQSCGGPNRLNLFWNGAPPPQINPGSGLWSYVGCYIEGETGRVLPNGVATVGGAGNTTVDLCLLACQNAGFNLAGAEYGQECWCGNYFSNGGILTTENGCTMLCANNKTEYCGGQNRLSIYNFNNTLNSTIQTGTPSTGTPSATPASPAIVATIGMYNYYGCQTEATVGRALTSNSTASDSMTLKYCAAWCVGYNFFGTEYGRECYCGNSFSPGSVSAPSNDCSLSCAANDSEFCGAGNRLSVYQLNGTSTPTSPLQTPTPTPLVLPLGWSYQGCWVDGAKGRILTYQQPDNPANTIEGCILTCSGLPGNYTISGLEYGVQCFCDTIIRNGGTNTTDSQCNFQCSGDSDEICGAGNRLSIYSIGTPVVFPAPVVQIRDLSREWE